MRRTRRLIAGLLAAVGVTTALAATPAGATPASPPTLVWTACGDGLECATAKVPLDHANPRGRLIDIALARRPATDRANRIGSIFINPGGPGAAGIPLVRADFTGLTPAVAARFDVIGFDPRGTGESTQVRCFDSTADQQAVWGSLPRIPVGPAQEHAVRRGLRAYTASCERKAGDLVHHLDSADVARDLDLLRAAVGDERLNYVGYSYGSFIGTVYANLFPHRVRALVLDGVVDPQALTRDGVSFVAKNAAAAEDALDSFAERCAVGDGCALDGQGATAESIRARIDALVAAARQAPLPAPTADPPGELTYSVAVNTILTLEYDPWFWGELATALAASSSDDGSALLTLARDFGIAGAATAPPDAPYRNADDAFSSVICGDSRYPDASAWPALAARADRVSPTFGRRWLYRVHQCATWPAEAARGRYTGPWDRRTAAPILVIGTTRDAATPLSSARTLARLLDRGRLLVHDGYGHTSLNDPSACSRAAVEAYVLRGELPPPRTVCATDDLPF